MIEDSPLTETALVAILECMPGEKFGLIKKMMSELRQSVSFLSDRFDKVFQRLNDFETNCDSAKNEAEVLSQVRISGILERHTLTNTTHINNNAKNKQKGKYDPINKDTLTSTTHNQK